MGHVHLTRELLEAMFGEDYSPRELIPRVLNHLFELCPQCEETFNEWRNSVPVAMTLSYGEIASNALDEATASLDRVREEEEQARGYLDDLLMLPPEQRASFVESVPKEVRGPALANGLIEAAREAVLINPHDSLALAQLARTVLQRADLSPFVTELYARAVAYGGNARRVLGNLPEAAEAIAHARFILRPDGGGDRLTRSEFDNLEGLVRLHQRNYPEAERLLKQAILGYRFAGAEREAIRSGINLAIVYRHSCNLKVCIQTQREILATLERWDEPRLTLFTRHNLAFALSDAGEHKEALALVAENRPAFEASGNQLGLLSLAWLEGSIAHGLGDLESAESHFLAARYGYAKHGLLFDAAWVSLDLVCVYLAQHRLDEVKALASELVRSFQGQERHSEALAAVLLFRAAAELKRVTADLVKELAVYLRQAPLDLSYKFTATRDSAN